MTKFIFFSKTMYSETPRIRHQLADLLVSYGHEVVFYQKPLFFFEHRNKLINQKISNNLTIKQTKQFLHHQLRLFGLLSYLNSSYEVQQITPSLGDIDESDVIINFNYDYDFLRNIFKKNKIITLINDDFVAQSKFNKGKHALQYLSNTVKMSDITLTVSYPLFAQASEFSKSVQMFLPWSKDKYSEPVKSSRNTVLLWAHIDKRIDFELVEDMLSKNSKFFFHFVGPVSEENLILVSKLKERYSNLILYPASSLEDLPLNTYFSSIIPYKAGVLDIEAVTASNKTFQLLSKGLPLVTYGMPSFFEHESIFKAKSYKEFSGFINKAYEDFESLQPSIKELVNKQQPAQRYEQIMSIINEEKYNV
ncbi:hypothetical protein MT378_01000 [Psychrobacter sp. 16-Bac2893]